MTDRSDSSDFPATVGRFQIVRRLGMGGMGDVYEGFDAAVNRYVAVKLLRRDLLEVPAIADTFVAEAQRIAKLEAHKNIPTIYEVGVHDGLPFIAMQKIDGQTLAHLLRKRGIAPIDTLRSVVSGVGGALAFAHERGIVHCDVKPQNVLLDRVHKPYLTDFGISRARPDPLGADVHEVAGHTPYYASPEQLCGRAPDARSDIYSLAVVIYEMCTGKTPFGDCSITGLADQVLQKTPEPANRVNPNVPARLAAVLARALEKEPARRPQSVMEFARDVLGATDDASRLWRQSEGAGAADVAIDTQLAAVLPPARPRRRGARTLAVVAAAGAAAVLAVVGWNHFAAASREQGPAQGPGTASNAGPAATPGVAAPAPSAPIDPGPAAQEPKNAVAGEPEAAPGGSNLKLPERPADQPAAGSGAAGSSAAGNSATGNSATGSSAIGEEAAGARETKPAAAPPAIEEPPPPSPEPPAPVRSASDVIPDPHRKPDPQKTQNDAIEAARKAAEGASPPPPAKPRSASDAIPKLPGKRD